MLTAGKLSNSFQNRQGFRLKLKWLPLNIVQSYKLMFVVVYKKMGIFAMLVERLGLALYCTCSHHLL